MAPRKKRTKAAVKTTRKTRSSAKSQPEESTEIPALAEENPTQNQPVQNKAGTASKHKKFGKFRCLLENTGNSDTGLETEEEQSTETAGSLETEECSEEVQEPEREKEDSEETGLISETCTDLEETEIDNSAVIDLAPAMNYSETDGQNLESLVEMSKQFCSLNVIEVGSNLVLDTENIENAMEGIDIIEQSDNITSANPIFSVDSIQSEFTVECVAEEIIPVVSEQEIEIATTSDNEQDVLEQSTVSNAIEQETNAEVIIQKPTNKSPKSKTPRSPRQKIAKPRSIIRRKPAPVIKMDKKEPKARSKGGKALEKVNSDTSESSTASENSVRRSSRIKSISVLKQRSKGQGLVKPKTEIEVKKSVKGSFNDSDTSENSNSGQTDSEKASADSPNFLTPSSGYDSDHKPVKVKSRWRRSSELEMGSTVTVNGNKNSTQTSVEGVQAAVSATVIANDDKTAANDEEIRNRLKQFVHLKENQYLTGRVSCKEAKKMTCDCFLTPEETERGELGCGEDCLNRLLMIECGPVCPVNDRCTNKRFQKSQFSPCEVFRTDKKGLGIRATANIPYGEFILEYVGEVIGPDEFEERATEYSKDKNPHYYFMSLRSDAVIDATQKGNISRFINHSCEPNAETQKWTVNGELRIGFFSKRTILAGEEITFDYQFQRYGKEAQKCFCEAPTCRGWLGEEPDEDEEEEEEEEEEEIEEEAEEKPEQPLQLQPAQVADEVPEKPLVETEIPVEGTEDVAPPVTAPVEVEVKKPVKKEKRKLIKRKVLKVRKDIFDDVDVDEEIEMLITTGLKNQAQTLKLSRLMVRANEASQRTILLRVLRRGEFPCRRLFLDYHGLRLIHGWMNDAQQLCKTDKKQESLRLELLQTLATLPIPNKTMLQDSKVLPTVEKWSAKLEDVPTGLDSESNSPKIEIDSSAVMETCENISESNAQSDNNVKTEEDLETNTKEEPVETSSKELDQNGLVSEALDEVIGDVEEIRRSVGMDIENIRSKNQWFVRQNSKKLVQDIIDMFDDDMDISPIAFSEDDNIIEVKGQMKRSEEPKQEEKNYEVEIIALAIKLLEEWSGLKEVFRIPKKERIEQMKEHEREADRGYKAGLEHDSERKSGSRYRMLQRHRGSDKTDFTERIRKSLKIDDRSSNPFPKINKHERRKLFAMQVEQEEVERRLKQRDMWRQHELQCMSMGTDPRFTAPFDPSRNYQCVWNQQTGQWQNYPINMNLLNPNMPPRFSSGMHYSYSTGGNIPPLPNMPPPLSNMSLPVPNMSLPGPNITLSAPNMSMQGPNVSMPGPNMPHSNPNMSNIPPNMPHPPPNMSNMPHMPPMSHAPPNMSHAPPNMSHALPNMSHAHPHMSNIPPNMSNPPLNMPHPPPNMTNMPPNMANMPPNMHHPLPNMSHMPPNMPHPPPNVSHPAQSMPHPMPTMSHPPQNLPLSTSNLSVVNIPTNIPPPLPNMPSLPNNSVIANVAPVPNNPVGNITNMPPLPNGPPPLPNMPPPNTPNVSNVPQQEKTSEKEDLSQVKFAGPIPPPVKLPPKWKCAKDKYGRPYYYHIKVRVSQWEPPEFPAPVDAEEESSDSTSSSETSSLSSDSSSEDSDDDDPDDTKLLLEIRKKFQQMDSAPKSASSVLEPETKDCSPDDSSSLKTQEQCDETVSESKSSLDERLKEEFNLSKRESQGRESSAKRKRLGLVTEVHIISPRSEEDKLLAKENLRKYKENKERLKRQKELTTEQTKKRVKVTVKSPKPVKKHKSTVKTKLKEAMDLNTETAKKIREAFRSNMAGIMVGILNPYRKPDCKEGRITNTEDFKHLARKLTHFVMLKELKHCQNIEDLTCTESVKSKAKEFVRKYMSKFGEMYNRPKDDLDY